MKNKHEYLDDLEKLTEDGQSDKFPHFHAIQVLGKPESNLTLLNPMKPPPKFPYAYMIAYLHSSKRHMILVI